MACYAPDDPQRSFDGRLWFAGDDSDVTHTLVHEYGHDVDNQLLNLGHLGACTFANDGSRNWFFERELEDNVFSQGGISCRPGSDWEHLPGEVFAEDLAQLNGVQGWVLRSVRPPTRLQLAALAFDTQERYRPTRIRWSPRVPATKRLRVRNWTILDFRAPPGLCEVVVRNRRGGRTRVVLDQL